MQTYSWHAFAPIRSLTDRKPKFDAVDAVKLEIPQGFSFWKSKWSGCSINILFRTISKMKNAQLRGKKYGQDFQVVFEALKQLFDDEVKPRKKIGYIKEKKGAVRQVVKKGTEQLAVCRTEWFSFAVCPSRKKNNNESL